MNRIATRTGWLAAGSLICLLVAGIAWAEDRTVAGVPFPETIEVDGQALTLNGTAVRKVFGFIKVFAGGFYCQRPVTSAEDAMAMDQTVQFSLHYLTSKATAEKLQNGFIEAITEANPADQVAAQQANIQKYAGWLDADMAPGKTSITTYVPGKGLSLVFQGQSKGTITDPDFIAIYFRYVFGEKANATLRDGYLGR